MDWYAVIDGKFYTQEGFGPLNATPLIHADTGTIYLRIEETELLEIQTIPEGWFRLDKVEREDVEGGSYPAMWEVEEVEYPPEGLVAASTKYQTKPKYRSIDAL